MLSAANSMFKVTLWQHTSMPSNNTIPVVCAKIYVYINTICAIYITKRYHQDAIDLFAIIKFKIHMRTISYNVLIYEKHYMTFLIKKEFLYESNE